MQAPELTFIDLFAGCGGLALGFVEAGFRPVGAVEIDAEAAETYRRNIDANIHAGDIATVEAWPRVDLVVGGPPCQGFSQLGSRHPHDPRNRLWQQYVRVLDATQAKCFVMENVPQLLRSGQFELFKEAVATRGFNVAERVLNAADYGVPQLRRRAIVVGSRPGAPVFPSPTHGPKSPQLAPYVTVRQAFEEPSRISATPDGKNWHIGRPGVRDFSLERYAAVPADGGNRFQMQENLDRAGRGELVPACWRNKPTGTTDVFGRLWWDRPSSTIRTEFYKPEKGRYLHPIAPRPITVREAARLQSFPDNFAFPKDQSMVSVARQIGNAVPPRLARAIAIALRSQMAREDSAGVISGSAQRELASVR